jgi:hypothetical protein
MFDGMEISYRKMNRSWSALAVRVETFFGKGREKRQPRSVKPRDTCAVASLLQLCSMTNVAANATRLSK